MDEIARKQMIQQAFDTVATGYDHPSLSFFPETAKRIIQHLDLNDDANLLDVCTGTGVVALEAAQKVLNGQVTGIDLSTGMLAQAQSKAENLGLNNVSFQQQDLDSLDFPDQQFDVATCSFGLFFINDMQTALNNIAAKVKDNGRVAITSFVEPAFEPLSDVFLKRYESFGKEIPPLSWKRLATEDLLREIFSDVGINNVDIYSEPLGFNIDDPQYWWDIVWNAGYRGLLNQLTEEQRDEFKEVHMKEVADQCAKEPVWLNTGVLIAVGHK